MPRGKKASEELVMVSFRMKRSTHDSLRALYPRTGYSSILRRLAERHVANRLSEELESIGTDDTEGTVREATESADAR